MWQTIRNILLVALLAAACFFVVELGLLVKDTRGLVAETNQKLDGTFRNLNAILVQAGLVAARVEDASRDLSSVATAQKKYWDDIGRSTAQLTASANTVLTDLSKVANSVDVMVRNTDEQVNGHLLPASESTFLEAKNSLTTISQSAITLAEGSKTALDDLHRILADENWNKTLKGLSDASASAAVTSAEIAEAAKQLPSIAGSMEKIAKTSSKWQKIQIPISIVSLLWRTFFW